MMFGERSLFTAGRAVQIRGQKFQCKEIEEGTHAQEMRYTWRYIGTEIEIQVTFIDTRERSLFTVGGGEASSTHNSAP